MEETVEFWRLIFTRYSMSEVVFHDRSDPGTVYNVVGIEHGSQARQMIEEERKRIVSVYGLEGEKHVRAQRGVKERFASGLALSGKYLEQMRQIFREEGLPIELTALPLIESSFEVKARSSAGALGIWQFTRSTGKQFLRVSHSVDERRDPLESTRAAARLLKENYRLFGNWPLAITAYNHGRVGVSRAVAEAGSSDLVEIIRRYESPYFGFASKNFYAEFLAALDVSRRTAEFFPDIDYHPPFLLEEIEAEEMIPIAALLAFAKTPRKIFLDWNPALSSSIRSVPKGYRIKVPPDRLEAFASAHRTITETHWIPHQVGRGETLSHIATLYGVSTRKIQQFNGLENAHLLSVGQRLKIPKR